MASWWQCKPFVFLFLRLKILIHIWAVYISAFSVLMCCSWWLLPIAPVCPCNLYLQEYLQQLGHLILCLLTYFGFVILWSMRLRQDFFCFPLAWDMFEVLMWMVSELMLVTKDKKVSSTLLYILWTEAIAMANGHSHYDHFPSMELDGFYRLWLISRRKRREWMSPKSLKNIYQIISFYNMTCNTCYRI